MIGDHYEAEYRRTETRDDAYARGRERRIETDVSSGWKEEFEAVHVPIPDGGTEYLIPDPGTEIFDREDLEDERIEPSRAVVIDVYPTVPAAGFYIDDLDATVAELNEGWDADSPVVEIAFVDEIGHAGGDPEDITAAECERLGISTYSYPSERVVCAERVSDAFVGGERR